MKALLLAPMGSVHRRFNKANIDALKYLGYEVHLAANFSVGDGTEAQNAEYVDKCLKEGIHIHSIEYERHSLAGSLAKTKETRELLQKEQYDIVHAHTETGGLILKLAGKPYKKSRYFYTPHGMSFYVGSSLKSQMIYRPVEKWICSGMNTSIAINQEEYSVLKRWDKNKAAYVHGIGLELERFENKEESGRTVLLKEFGIPEGSRVIISVGELDDNKNHEVIIRALAELQRSDVYYVICGVGPKKKELEGIINQCGLDGHVLLVGYRKDIPQILRIGDVFAFPSFHEGLPVSMMEAMAAGLPVVCSKIRGNVDLIEDGEGGFLCAPDDIEAFQISLRKMIGATEIREKMGIVNYENVQKFGIVNVEKELREVYRRILK